MKFREYISSHHVFATEDLLRGAGPYASYAGRFEGAGVDPYEVATALDPDAVLSMDEHAMSQGFFLLEIGLCALSLQHLPRAFNICLAPSPACFKR